MYPYFGYHHHDPYFIHHYDSYFNLHYDPYFNHQYEDTYKVTSLSPGTKYNFTLYSVLYGIRSRGYNFSAETTPAKVTGLHCEYSWLGSVVNLVWDAPDGLWSEFEVQVNEGIPKHVNITRYQIDDVLSSVQYEISVTSLSGKLRSDPVSVVCQTNASGAIAGSMLAVFLIILLVSIGVFCIHKKFDLRRCFFGKENVEKTSNLPMDLIYVNTSTHNTQENQDSSVKSENIDISEENSPYEVLH
nr:receptor-type tyrosine-protein phosphatase H-like [Misgurnus anguillicaudatus]